MIEPKTSIYNLLSTVGTTYQAMPEVEVTYPCLTFSIAEDRPEYTMDGEISHQVVVVNVDLWAETSSGTSSMLVDLVTKMLSGGYRMTACSDIPVESGSHLSTTFETIVG